MKDLSLFKLSKRAGKIPGSVEYTGEHKFPTKINILHYNSSQYKELNDASIHEIKKTVQPDSVTWIDVIGLSTEKVLTELMESQNMHPMLQEDISNTEQLSKTEDFGEHYILTLKMLQLDDNEEITQEHVSIILGNNCIYSFQEKPGDVFNEIRNRIRNSIGKIRQKSNDYLFCVLTDAIVDQYFGIFESVRTDIEKLEVKLLHERKNDLSEEIIKIRKEIIKLRRWVMPLREALIKVKKTESPFISKERRHFLQDISEQLDHIIHFFDSFRDMVNYLMDLNHTNLTNQTNEIVKTLTVISAIFIPLTFLAGLYGMNFKYMPELEYKDGYYILLSVMAIIFIVSIIATKKRGWW